MSAQDNLSPKQFYHGSPINLPEGTVLTPGSSRGVNNHPPAGDNSKVWMAHTPWGASRWGNTAALNSRRRNVHVYEVEPLEDHVDMGHESAASSARIVRKLNTNKAKR